MVRAKLRPATWHVTALAPGKEFTWEARQPGLRVVAGHCIQAEEARVTLTLAFESWMPPLVWPLVRRIVCA